MSKCLPETESLLSFRLYWVVYWDALHTVLAWGCINADRHGELGIVLGGLQGIRFLLINV